ncbi:hypothetical protein ACHAWF_016324 [Thalassiosira exigua]
MALRGDDEVESLMLEMAGGGEPTPAAAASSAAASTPSSSDLTRGKTSRKKKRRKNDGTKVKDGLKKKSKRNGSMKATSFADTRLTQNCFEWPRSSEGRRWLSLGPGLLHDCEGYAVSSSDDRREKETCYGSSPCRSCGKSAATHELRLSSSCAEEIIVDAAESHHAPPIPSMARVIIAARNARCLMSEYHPASKQRNSPDQQKNAVLPPLNSIPFRGEAISNRIDVFVGSVLASARKLQEEMTEKDHPRYQYATRNDDDLLQRKVLALIEDAQGFKDATREPRKAIDLVERRLSAMASCDAVYYRCYYAAITSCNASNKPVGGNDVAALIPHPPTYFSCPGLAWDVHGGGVASLRIFLGEATSCPSGCDDLKAPIDDATRDMVMKSWGLRDRLDFASSYLNIGCASAGKGSLNPLLILWQSRFLESARHVWCTRYSKIKSSVSFREASNSANETKSDRSAHTDSQDSLLKTHETTALSYAMAKWRDSVRDYPANFYAYAVPTRDALQSILNCLVSFEQMLEAGAGTGYWSCLVRSHLKNNVKLPSAVPLVTPYDIIPPSPALNGGGNEYHGCVPSFIEIHQADNLDQALSSAAMSPNPALFLCYPPPGSDMAERALSAHLAIGGDAVVHIGEWQGLTGDASFETLLTQRFYCLRHIPLPFWGTDATYLTVWRKKGGDEICSPQEAAQNSQALGYCSLDHCSKRAKRRCQYARCIQYCSMECFQKHFSRRRALLALHMICMGQKDSIDYEDDGHFMDLSQAEPASNIRPKKKRKKKKR